MSNGQFFLCLILVYYESLRETVEEGSNETWTFSIETFCLSDGGYLRYVMYGNKM